MSPKVFDEKLAELSELAGGIAVSDLPEITAMAEVAFYTAAREWSRTHSTDAHARLDFAARRLDFAKALLSVWQCVRRQAAVLDIACEAVPA